MRAFTVLRSGGEYTPTHVERLEAQIVTWAPSLELVCLTDYHEASWLGSDIQLTRGYPGWWSKMELFRPDIEGDILYFDLDTTIVGPLDGFDCGVVTLLRDFYRPDGLGSGLMFLPESARREVWDKWIEKPEHYIANTRRGDQGFLETVWLDRASRWQDVLPGKVVSYKVDVRSTGKVPAGASVVCFHGKPRPWAVPELVP